MRYFVFLLLLLACPSDAFAHGMSEEDKSRMLQAGYLEYVLLGAKHMLTGYDHLLFILGVVFYLTRFGEVVKFITAFTLGHCITLIAATLLHVQVNEYLIDAIIALTVMYKAFDNLGGFQKALGVEPPSLLGMVFAFGLIHGMGLSTRLQHLPLGDDTTGLVLRILSFNLGVELGQIVALAVMVALLAGFRRASFFGPFSKASNYVLIGIGGLLLLFQLHGYLHTHEADHFPVNADDHAHLHEQMLSEPAKAP